MKKNVLRLLRVISAVLIFSLILLFFCDFTGRLPKHLHGILHVQFVPAIMAGSIAIIIGLCILTILFGRIYCSIICPLGVLQDIIAWFTGRGKKKNRKKRWYKYAKPLTVLRYSLLGLFVLSLIFGISIPVLLLEPYSHFGRIAVNLLRPLLMEGNNLLNWVALKFHIYNFYYVTVNTVTGWSFAFAATVFLIVGIMALLRGRLYCNTLCPVGSFLGLFARFSLFKISMDKTLCNSCGLCEKACKSQCINSEMKYVDHSRCVACFNCLKRCKSDGVSYRFSLNQSFQNHQVNEMVSPEIGIVSNTTGMNRRSFFVTSTAIAATLPILPAWSQSGQTSHNSFFFQRKRRIRRRQHTTNNLPVTPPGSMNLKHFERHCTACHLCITHCPQQVLKPAGFNYGINYTFKPHLVFYEKGFCNYECTVCSEVCPTGAIRKLTKEEKKVTQIGIAQFHRNHCIVITEGTSCGACSEHCPTQAVRMDPYINGLTLPHIENELCIGCGGCESICPVRPDKAIVVLANEVHQTAVKPVEEEMLEIKQENLIFGF